MKIHNFSAGPSILPKEVMQKASQAVKELDDSGLSLIEISHRSKNFVDIMDEACEKALNITKLNGKGYKALATTSPRQYLAVSFILATDHFLRIAHIDNIHSHPWLSSRSELRAIIKKIEPWMNADRPVLLGYSPSP